MDFSALAGLTAIGRKDVINDLTKPAHTSNTSAEGKVSFDSLFQSDHRF